MASNPAARPTDVEAGRPGAAPSAGGGGKASFSDMKLSPASATEDIPIEVFPEELHQALREIDADGSGTISAREIGDALRFLAEVRKRNKWLRSALLVLVCFVMLMLAAISGLTYAMIEVAKESEVSGSSNVMVAAGTSTPVQTAVMVEAGGTIRDQSTSRAATVDTVSSYATLLDLLDLPLEFIDQIEGFTFMTTDGEVHRLRSEGVKLVKGADGEPRRIVVYTGRWDTTILITNTTATLRTRDFATASHEDTLIVIPDAAETTARRRALLAREESDLHLRCSEVTGACLHTYDEILHIHGLHTDTFADGSTWMPRRLDGTSNSIGYAAISADSYALAGSSGYVTWSQETEDVVANDDADDDSASADETVDVDEFGCEIRDGLETLSYPLLPHLCYKWYSIVGCDATWVGSDGTTHSASDSIGVDATGNPYTLVDTTVINAGAEVSCDEVVNGESVPGFCECGAGYKILTGACAASGSDARTGFTCRDLCAENAVPRLDATEPLLLLSAAMSENELDVFFEITNSSGTSIATIREGVNVAVQYGYNLSASPFTEELGLFAVSDEPTAFQTLVQLQAKDFDSWSVDSSEGVSVATGANGLQYVQGDSASSMTLASVDTYEARTPFNELVLDCSTDSDLCVDLKTEAASEASMSATTNCGATWDEWLDACEAVVRGEAECTGVFSAYYQENCKNYDIGQDTDSDGLGSGFSHQQCQCWKAGAGAPHFVDMSNLVRNVAIATDEDADNGGGDNEYKWATWHDQYVGGVRLYYDSSDDDESGCIEYGSFVYMKYVGAQLYARKKDGGYLRFGDEGNKDKIYLYPPRKKGLGSAADAYTSDEQDEWMSTCIKYGDPVVLSTDDKNNWQNNDGYWYGDSVLHQVSGYPDDNPLFNFGEHQEDPDTFLFLKYDAAGVADVSYLGSDIQWDDEAFLMYMANPGDVHFGTYKVRSNYMAVTVARQGETRGRIFSDTTRAGAWYAGFEQDCSGGAMLSSSSTACTDVHQSQWVLSMTTRSGHYSNLRDASDVTLGEVDMEEADLALSVNGIVDKEGDYEIAEIAVLDLDELVDGEEYGSRSRADAVDLVGEYFFKKYAWLFIRAHYKALTLASAAAYEWPDSSVEGLFTATTASLDIGTVELEYVAEGLEASVATIAFPEELFTGSTYCIIFAARQMRTSSSDEAFLRSDNDELQECFNEALISDDDWDADDDAGGSASWGSWGIAACSLDTSAVTSDVSLSADAAHGSFQLLELAVVDGVPSDSILDDMILQLESRHASVLNTTDDGASVADTDFSFALNGNVDEGALTADVSMSHQWIIDAGSTITAGENTYASSDFFRSSDDVATACTAPASLDSIQTTNVGISAAASAVDGLYSSSFAIVSLAMCRSVTSATTVLLTQSSSDFCGLDGSGSTNPTCAPTELVVLQTGGGIMFQWLPGCIFATSYQVRRDTYTFLGADYAHQDDTSGMTDTFCDTYITPGESLMDTTEEILDDIGGEHEYCVRSIVVVDGETTVSDWTCDYIKIAWRAELQGSATTGDPAFKPISGMLVDMVTCDVDNTDCGIFYDGTNLSSADSYVYYDLEDGGDMLSFSIIAPTDSLVSASSALDSCVLNGTALELENVVAVDATSIPDFILRLSSSHGLLWYAESPGCFVLAEDISATSFTVGGLGLLEVPSGGLGSFAYHFRVVREPSWEYMAVHCRDACGLASEDFLLDASGDRSYFDPRSSAFCATWASRCPDAGLETLFGSAEQRGAAIFGSDDQEQDAILCDPYAGEFAYYDATYGYACCSNFVPSQWDTCNRRFTACDTSEGVTAASVDGQPDGMQLLIQTAFEAEGSTQRMAYEALSEAWFSVDDVELDSDSTLTHSVGIVPDFSGFAGAFEYHVQNNVCLMVSAASEVSHSGSAATPLTTNFNSAAAFNTTTGMSLYSSSAIVANTGFQVPAGTMSSSTFTISVTFRIDTNDDDDETFQVYLFLSKNDAGVWDFGFQCRPDLEVCRWWIPTVYDNDGAQEYSRSSYYAYTPGFVDGEFHQATLVFSSDTVKMYHDGVLLEIGNFDGFREDERFYQPEMERDNGGYFGSARKGTTYMRHFEIFDVALDSEQVEELYTSYLDACLPSEYAEYTAAADSRALVVGHAWVGDAEQFTSTRTDSAGSFAVDLVLTDENTEAYRDVKVLPFIASEFQNSAGGITAYFHDVPSIDVGSVHHRSAQMTTITDATAVVISVHVDHDGVASPDGCPAADVLICAYESDAYEATSLDCGTTDASGDAALSVPAGISVYLHGGCAVGYAADDRCEELGDSVRTRVDTYHYKTTDTDGGVLYASPAVDDDVVGDDASAVQVSALVSAAEAEAGATVFFRDASVRSLAVDLLAGRSSNTTDAAAVDRSLAWHLSSGVVAEMLLDITADADSTGACSLSLTPADASAADVGGETLTFSIPRGLDFTAALSFNTTSGSSDVATVAAYLEHHVDHAIEAGANATRIYYHYRAPATVAFELSELESGSSDDASTMVACGSVYAVSRFSDNNVPMQVFVSALVTEVYAASLVENDGLSATLQELEGTLTAADGLAAGAPYRQLVAGVDVASNGDESNAYDSCSSTACKITFGQYSADDAATVFAYEILELGLPDVESPYTKTIQAFFEPSVSDVGSADLVDLLTSEVAAASVVIVGDVPLSNFETIKLPEYVPFLILRDPPGGGSTASWEKGSSFTVAVEDSEVWGFTYGAEGTYAFGAESAGSFPLAPLGPEKRVNYETEAGIAGENSLGVTETTVKGRTITITAAETISTSAEIDTSSDSADLFVVPSLSVMTTRVLPIRFNETTCAGYEMSEQTTWSLLAGAFTNEKNLTETLKEYSSVQHAVVGGDDGEDNELEPIVGKVKANRLTNAERYRLKTLAQAAIEDDSSWNSLTVHSIVDVLAVRIPQLQARCQEEFYRLLCHGSSFTYEGEFKDHIRDQLPEGALDSYVDEVAAAYASWCAFSTTTSSGLTCASYAAFDADAEDFESAAIWRLEAAIMGISGWRYTLTLNEQLKDSSVALTRKQLASAPTKGSNFEQTSDLKFSNLENQFFDANGKPSGGADGGFRGDVGLVQGGDSSAELSSIAFSGGGAEFTYTVETEVTKAIDVGLLVDFAYSLGHTAETTYSNYAHIEAETQSMYGFMTEHDEHTEKERASTTVVTFTLTDGDVNDYFDVGVSMDPVYGTPVFKTLAGRSSCPHEAHTDSREVFSISYSDDNELDMFDMAGLTANDMVRNLVRPTGASPGTCASFAVDVSNLSNFGDYEDLEFEVRPPQYEEMSGLSFKTRGLFFYERFKLPTMSSGDVIKYRVDVCPNEDERDFAVRSARFASENVLDANGNVKNGAVYCDLQLTLVSSCEKDMSGSMAKIARYDEETMVTCEDYNFVTTYPESSNMCWHKMLDEVFDDSVPYQFASENIFEDAVTIKCLSFDTTTDACADDPCGT